MPNDGTDMKDKGHIKQDDFEGSLLNCRMLAEPLSP